MRKLEVRGWGGGLHLGYPEPRAPVFDGLAVLDPEDVDCLALNPPPAARARPTQSRGDFISINEKVLNMNVQFFVCAPRDCHDASELVESA